MYTFRAGQKFLARVHDLALSETKSRDDQCHRISPLLLGILAKWTFKIFIIPLRDKWGSLTLRAPLSPKWQDKKLGTRYRSKEPSYRRGVATADNNLGEVIYHTRNSLITGPINCCLSCILFEWKINNGGLNEV